MRISSFSSLVACFGLELSDHSLHLSYSCGRIENILHRSRFSCFLELLAPKNSTFALLTRPTRPGYWSRRRSLWPWYSPFCMLFSSQETISSMNPRIISDVDGCERRELSSLFSSLIASLFLCSWNLSDIISTKQHTTST